MYTVDSLPQNEGILYGNFLNNLFYYPTSHVILTNKKAARFIRTAFVIIPRDYVCYEYTNTYMACYHTSLCISVYPCSMQQRSL